MLYLKLIRGSDGLRTNRDEVQFELSVARPMGRESSPRLNWPKNTLALSGTKVRSG